jgi:hypothetical protein
MNVRPWGQGKPSRSVSATRAVTCANRIGRCEAEPPTRRANSRSPGSAPRGRSTVSADRPAESARSARGPPAGLRRLIPSKIKDVQDRPSADLPPNVDAVRVHPRLSDAVVGRLLAYKTAGRIGPECPPARTARWCDRRSRACSGSRGAVSTRRAIEYPRTLVGTDASGTALDMSSGGFEAYPQVSRCLLQRKGGAPRGIRTPDRRIRSPMLYPAELWAPVDRSECTDSGALM